MTSICETSCCKKIFVLPHSFMLNAITNRVEQIYQFFLTTTIRSYSVKLGCHTIFGYLPWQCALQTSPIRQPGPAFPPPCWPWQLCKLRPPPEWLMCFPAVAQWESEGLHYDSEAGELFPRAPSITWATMGTRCRAQRSTHLVWLRSSHQRCHCFLWSWMGWSGC